MILITTIGLRRYERTVYRWEDGQAFETRFFAEALCKWLKPTEVRVLLTKGAEGSDNWRDLRSALEGRALVVPVAIPDGANEAEVWEIVRVLTGSIAKDEVVLDVTHGFRSLPFLVAMTAAFLRAAGKMNVTGIYYGAFDARDGDNVAPVFDLTPLLHLLDLAGATSIFTATGDAARLGRLLVDQHVVARRNPSSSMLAEEAPVRLRNLGSRIEDLALALGMGRPAEAPKAAAALLACLDEARAQAEVERWLPAFGLLLDEIRATYAPLARPGDDLDAELASQWPLIEWYFDRGQTFVAVPVAREWLVSIVCRMNGLQWMQRDERERAEKCLTALVRAASGDHVDSARGSDALTTGDLAVPLPAEIANLWQNVCGFRNDAMHCGLTLAPGQTARDVRSAGSLSSGIEGLCGSLQDVAAACGWASGSGDMRAVSIP
ncbi:MAG TPA: TIGR02221 family CRISPR-associated protein [Chthonomonadaceae bacterium]|nr:TIGR02221 family CRISPR-associated protein [Chthonomonadaceae bacterium]